MKKLLCIVALLAFGTAQAQEKVILGISGWTGFQPLKLAELGNRYKVQVIEGHMPEEQYFEVISHAKFLPVVNRYAGSPSPRWRDALANCAFLLYPEGTFYGEIAPGCFPFKAETMVRDVAGHVQRIDTDLIQRDLWPFLRDLYDHLARNMDMVETQRDLLTGAMDVYLSSVANRTNQVMKVLTVLGTIALPSIVISGFFGMNLQSLPWANWPHGTWMAAGMMGAATAVLLIVLKKWGWY